MRPRVKIKGHNLSGIADDFWQRTAVARDDWGAECHCFDDWCTKPFISAREHQCIGECEQTVTIGIAQASGDDHLTPKTMRRNGSEYIAVGAPLTTGKHDLGIAESAMTCEVEQELVILVRVRDSWVREHASGGDAKATTQLVSRRSPSTERRLDTMAHDTDAMCCDAEVINHRLFDERTRHGDMAGTLNR
jgi:hypothetical protein